MADIVLDPRSPHALALREPNLLVPGVKPTIDFVVNKNHPLASALVCAIVPKNGVLVDVVNGRIPDYVNGSPVGSYEGKGGVFEFDRTTSSYIDTGIIGNSLTAWSFVTSLYTKAPIVRYFQFLGNRGSSGSPGVSLHTDYALIEATVFGVAGYNFSGGDTDWYGKWHTTGGSWTGSGGDIHLYQQGIKTSTIDVASGGMADTNIFVGKYRAADTGTLDDGFEYWFLFDREISAADHLSIKLDPWQLFAPANQTPFLVGVPAGGGATGTGDISSQSSDVSGSGTIGRVGTGSFESQGASVAGTGSVSGAVTGTGVLTDQSSDVSGSGVIGHSGTGSIDSQSSDISGSGVIGHVGTGSLDAQSSSVDGTGTVTSVGAVTGTGTIDSQDSSIDGTGVIGRTGTGAIQCGTATINGIGIVSGNIAGSGGFESQASTISGTGTVYTPANITGTGSLVCGSSSVSGYDDTTYWTEVPGSSTTWTTISEDTTTWTEI